MKQLKQKITDVFLEETVKKFKAVLSMKSRPQAQKLVAVEGKGFEGKL